MFTINNKTDYGLLLLSELLNQKKHVSLAKLVKNVHLPPRFVARIASDLAHSGILESREGKSGGYKLVKDPKKINLFAFLQIFNKDLEIVKCQRDRFTCRFDRFCNHKFFLRKKLSGYILAELKKWTLADLLK